MRGPFLRVTKTNSCLNIRQAPDAGTAVQECVADDVLLRDLEETQTVGAETWRRVRASDGKEGWANTAYTESE